MKTIGKIVKFVFKLVLILSALAAAAGALSLGCEHAKNRYLVQVDLEDDE